MPRIPKLVNRGPAGLLTKLSGQKQEQNASLDNRGSSVEVNKIASALREMIVEISLLKSDPNNARLHPDRNVEAIKQSLVLYGQVKPVVVRKQTRIVMAGNGTLEAAVSLGWTRIAAVFVEMTDVEAAGYGIADNRTAELARWDFEVVARLDRLLQEVGQSPIGFSQDEVGVLRAADWIAPPISEDGYGGKKEGNSLLVSFTPDQYEAVDRAINALRDRAFADGKDGPSSEECLEIICLEWLEENK